MTEGSRYTGPGRRCTSGKESHSLFTGSTFCGDTGGTWTGSWFSSSFLLRMSLKKIRIRGTPHRNCSCLVTKGMDSLRLGESRRAGTSVPSAGWPRGRVAGDCHSARQVRCYKRSGIHKLPLRPGCRRHQALSWLSRSTQTSCAASSIVAPPRPHVSQSHPRHPLSVLHPNSILFTTQSTKASWCLRSWLAGLAHKSRWKGGSGGREAGRDKEDGDLPPELTHSPRIGRTSQGQGASGSGWISSGTRTSDSSRAFGWANSQIHLSPPLTPWGWGSPSAGGCLQREKAECGRPGQTCFLTSQPCSLPGAPASMSTCRKKFHVERNPSVLGLQCCAGLRNRQTWPQILALPEAS